MGDGGLVAAIGDNETALLLVSLRTILVVAAMAAVALMTVLVTEMLVVAVEFVPLLVVLVKFIGGGNFISVTK